MLSRFFLDNLSDSGLKIEENIVELRIKFSPGSRLFGVKDQFLDALRSIPERDRFDLCFDIDGEEYSISDLLVSSVEVIEEAITETQSYDSEVKLVINKSKHDDTISIYFLDYFFEYLVSEAIGNVLSTFSRNIGDGLNFEVFSEIGGFSTGGLNFFPSSNPVDVGFTSPKQRSCQLEMFRENTDTNLRGLSLIASDFYVPELPDGIKGAGLFFDRAAALLSLSYISSSTEVSDKEVSYKINGYKSISSKGLCLDSLASSVKELHKIYAWVYSDGSVTDKLGLVRNVLSLHLDEEGNVLFDAQAWNAINSNYQIYLKGNIQGYLEVKNKIGEMVVETTSKIHALADEMASSFKNSVFIIATFMLSVVIVNGLKDNGQEDIFSGAYLGVVFLVSAVSGLWMAFTKSVVEDRFYEASKSIKKTLKMNYKQIVMESEIDDFVDPIIFDNEKYLKRQVRNYSSWGRVMLFGFVGIYTAVFFIMKDAM